MRHAFTFLIHHTHRKAYFLLFSASSIKAFFESYFSSTPTQFSTLLIFPKNKKMRKNFKKKKKNLTK
jgi:hypothetical protein